MLQEFCSVVTSHALDHPSTRGSVALVEEAEQVKVTISGVPSETVVIRLDRHACHMEKVVQQRGDLHRICDYLLITYRHDEVRAILVEIKKHLGDSLWRKGAEQVCRSLPFFYYLHSVAQVEHDGSCVSCDEVSRFYWVLAPRQSRGIDKQRTRAGSQQARIDSRHGVTVRGIAGMRIPFNRLVPP